MKYLRFYQEFSDKKKKKSTGNVMAVSVDKKGHAEIFFSHNEPMVSVISAVFDQPNSPVVGGNASIGYLHEKTKRVSEDKAKRIHPALFKYLE